MLIGAEPHLPYQRPPLSKGFLAGTVAPERLLLRQADFYERSEVETMLDTVVTALDLEGRTVRLDDGGEQAFDRLLLATGGRPRLLSCAGADHPRVHYLRTMAQVEALRAWFSPGKRVVLVGGGYIGLEIAAVAARMGLAVTVVEAAPNVLSRVTCTEVASFFERVHRRAGVEILCDAAVEAIEDDHGAAVVVASDGRRVHADLVVAGIGLIPNTALAESAGLACDNGILVDENCCTSVASVFAAGDCTRHPSELYGRSLRLESVHNAIEQGKTAAASICGVSRPYRQVPWFWSDQYDLKLQTAGISQGYDRVVMRGDPETGSFAAIYLKDDRVLAVDAINRPAEFSVGKSLVHARAKIAPERLADDSAPLKALLA